MLGLTMQQTQQQTNQHLSYPFQQQKGDDLSLQPQSPLPSAAQSPPNRARRRRRQRKRPSTDGTTTAATTTTASVMKGKQGSKSTSTKPHDAPMTKKDLYFCLRCGMVRVATRESAVGRVTIVNWDNSVVMDTFVKVPVPVRDYRTLTTGITKEDLQKSSSITFENARSRVAKILKGKILIGHGLEMDLQALGLQHPWSDIRELSTYAPYMKEAPDPTTDRILSPRRDLPRLIRQFLYREAPVSGPVEEAICILDLYKLVRDDFEAHLILKMQEKERQRVLGLSTRPSGYNCPSMPLTAIQEGLSYRLAGTPQKCSSKKGHRFLSEHSRKGEGTLSGSTAPPSTYSGESSDISSSHYSPVAAGSHSLSPRCYPSRFENLHEIIVGPVAERRILPEAIRYVRTWSQDDYSEISSLGSPTYEACPTHYDSTVGRDQYNTLLPQELFHSQRRTLWAVPPGSWSSSATPVPPSPPPPPPAIRLFSSLTEEQRDLERHLPSELLDDLNREVNMDQQHCIRGKVATLGTTTVCNQHQFTSADANVSQEIALVPFLATDADDCYNLMRSENL